MSEKQASPDNNPMQESLTHSSWDLVHSKRLEDVKRGIAIIQSSLPSTVNLLQQREELYLLAVGYYKSGDYLRSRYFVDKCLKIAPDWRQVLSLKAAIDDLTKGSHHQLLMFPGEFYFSMVDGVIDLLTNVGVVAGLATGYIADRKILHILSSMICKWKLI